MRLQAVNNVIILKKDESPSLADIKSSDIKQIPEPYTGYIDSIGFDTDKYKIGEHLVFCDMGGAYIQMGDIEYVVLTPEMVIGKIS